jgi:hypothetical protein
MWSRIAALGLALVALVALRGMAGAATTVERGDFSIEGDGIWIPCANGGLGEKVIGDGYYVWHTTFTERPDGWLAEQVIVLQGARFVGLTTGDKYVFIDQEKVADNFVGDGLVHQYAVRARLVGPQANYIQIATMHFTITANGDDTAPMSGDDITCG